MSDQRTVSKKIKTFIIKRSDLENRLDPKFIEPERLDFYKKLKSHGNIVKLKDIIIEGSYGILPPGESYNPDNPIKFIRATELKEDLSIDFENVHYVESKYYTKRAALKKHDILLAVKGATIAGVKCVAIVKDEIENCIINGSIFRMQVNENVNPYYIAYLLNSDLLKKQMKYNLIANNAVDYLDKKLINNLLIPLPTLKIQNEIVREFKIAYEKKKEKENESEELNIEINNFLNNSLSIHITQTKHDLKNRVFKVDFKQVTGKRFDSYFYLHQSIESKIDLGLYETVYFSNLIKRLTNGYDFRTYDSTGTPYVKVANIKKGEFDFSKIEYVQLNSDEIKKKIQLKKGNLLITRKGTFGNSIALKEDLNYIISSEVFYIEIKQELVDAKYLEIFLNSFIGQSQFDRVKIGAIMGSLSQEAIKKLKIPLPSIQKQYEIIRIVENFNFRIKDLKREGKEILEAAIIYSEKILFS